MEGCELSNDATVVVPALGAPTIKISGTFPSAVLVIFSASLKWIKNGSEIIDFIDI